MVYPKYPACLVLKMIVGPGWTAIVFDQTQTLNKKYSAFNYTMGYYTLLQFDCYSKRFANKTTTNSLHRISVHVL